MFLVFLFCSCGRPTYVSPHKTVGKWLDTTCVIANGDSYKWEKGRYVMMQEGAWWGSGDTLTVEVTQEAGPAIGHILLNEGYNGTYTTIFQQDSVYSVNWVHKFKNYTGMTQDTIALTINNTSTSETLRINVKVEIINWDAGCYESP